MEKRVIPLKNYLIFALVAILSFLFVFNLSRWYRQNKIYTTSLSKVISEVLPSELKDYLTENGTIVIYASSSVDEKLEEFENEFKQYIIDNQIENMIIYYDVNKDDNKFFENELKTILTYPNLYLIKEHELSTKLYYETKEINLEEVKTFLELNEVVDIND
jgi:hypothetical protein